jgi:hypothetical protein
MKEIRHHRRFARISACCSQAMIEADRALSSAIAILLRPFGSRYALCSRRTPPVHDLLMGPPRGTASTVLT